MSEILRQAGWTTAGFVDTPWLGSFGFDRGYSHYDAESPPPGFPRRGASVIRERLVDWLSGAGGDVFVFWHLMDAHGSYGAPASFGGRFRRGLEVAPDGRLEELGRLAYHDYLQLGRFRTFEDLVAAYDEGVATADAEVGRLLDLLRRSGLYDDALIVVTSDHGESLMERGIWVGHGLFLTEEEIRIPLLMKLPGNEHAGTRVAGMVRLIDVAPTLLGVVDVPQPSTFEGVDLVHPRPGSPRSLPRVAFGTSTHTGARYARTHREKLITAWTTPRDVVVQTHLRPRAPAPALDRIESGERLYDLSADAGEAAGVGGSPESRRRGEDLREVLAKHVERLAVLRGRLAAPGGGAKLSPDQIRRLQGLGYLGGEGN